MVNTVLLISHYRNGAKKRGIVTLLTDDLVWRLTTIREELRKRGVEMDKKERCGDG